MTTEYEPLSGHQAESIINRKENKKMEMNGFMGIFGLLILLGIFQNGGIFGGGTCGGGGALRFGVLRFCVLLFVLCLCQSIYAICGGCAALCVCFYLLFPYLILSIHFSQFNVFSLFYYDYIIVFYLIIKKEKKTAIMITHDIAEAISLADRVIVLSKRPGTIKVIYDINLTNKSTPIENRKAKEFSEYYELLWKDLDINV